MQPLLPEPAPLVSMTPPFPGSSLRSRAPSSFAPTSTTAAHVPPPSSPGLNTDTPQARVEQQRPELGHSSSSARAIPRDTEFEIVHDSGISTAHAKPNITLGPKKNISPSQSPLRSPPPPPTTTAASSPESPTQAPAPAISHHPPLPDVRAIFLHIPFALGPDPFVLSCLFFDCAVIRFISHGHIYAYEMTGDTANIARNPSCIYSTR